MLTPELLITGGASRKDAEKLGNGQRFECAKLIRLDTRTREVSTPLSYQGNPHHYPDELPNILFTAATFEGDILYLPTETEIHIYSYPELKLLGLISFPFFQNIHQVCPIGEYIAVASTGLDMVVLIDKKTHEPVEFYNALFKDPWHRFSRDVDYRKINSTAPHDSHPNFVFAIGDEIWVTRFVQRDAVSLANPNRRIQIASERVHDGHQYGNLIYFTTVNGHIVIVDPETLSIHDDIDLNEIEAAGRPLGWCRGVLIDGEIAYVGFSMMRQTKIKENVKWALSYVGVRKNPLKTRVCVYNLKDRVKLDEFVLPTGTIDAIYSILKPPVQE